jgi:hypothetical protein
MFNCPGRNTILRIDVMTACCVTKKRCSKDVGIRCSLPPPPDKG